MLEIVLAFFFVLILIPLIKFLTTKRKNKKNALIVVLGDIGRSPRMNYHLLSLVKIGYTVSIIGYKETKQMDEVENNSNVKIVPLSSYPKFLQIGPQIFQYGLKAIFLSLNLLITLFRLDTIPNFVLVQNPPSVPTLALVYFYSKIVKTKFLIDWHNYGFTILALKRGKENILVKICKSFELFFGNKSHFNFCVTEAMKNNLETFNIKATTMHDKAHERFRELNIKEKHDFYLKLIHKYKLDDLNDKDENTILTQKEGNNYQMKSKRPVILVSSSSWTEDEDFHLLIEAFEIYQKNCKENNSNKPNIICMLTGKGPLKDYYVNLFEEKKFENIKVYFLWLDPSDYPLLLGSADLGLCFHKSSSNLDLPMKVVDMFGVKLPVCAFDFTCISELVKNDENGLLFSNGKQLAEHFSNLLTNLNDENSKLVNYRKNLQKFSNWNEEWNNKIKPIIDSI